MFHGSKIRKAFEPLLIVKLSSSFCDWLIVSISNYRINYFRVPNNYQNMDLRNILAISGKPGLYKLLSSSASRIIVESIIDKKKMPVSSVSKISSLEDISIFTYEDDIPLAEVFQNIYRKEDGGQAIDHKSSAEELRAYMTEVLEDYDEDRVYNSDLKKMFQWYNLLNENGLIDLEDGESEEESAD